MNTPLAQPRTIRHRPGTVLDLVLIALILLGAVYRFAWVNWNQDTQLHPDEYGLTNTLTGLSLPESLADYFNTRVSPISPYNKYDESGNKLLDGPDNRMRWGQWPITLIRLGAELTGNTGYNEIRLMGRTFCAAADFMAVLLLIAIGQRLYNRRVGLLAGALSSLAVLQIQQSHFMTVDNFATFFCAAALYAAVRIAQLPAAVRKPVGVREYAFNPLILKWVVLFGVSFGMAMATKINLLPLAGMLLVAVFIATADLKLHSQKDLPRISWIALGLLVLGALVSLLVFRVTQPMSFRAETGNTTLLTTHLNPDWWDSMQVAQMESTGVGGGPPGEQWAARPAILFPLMNMVVWGLGLPLGLAGWAGFFRAAWQVIHSDSRWRVHLLPLIWVGGYFLFMGTRWVKSIRYFLPIYPFICLFAAWLIWDVWTRAHQKPASKRWYRPAAAIVGTLVLAGTLIWATVYVNSVYRQEHTRLQATEWIYSHVPAPVSIRMESAGETLSLPLSASEGTTISSLIPWVRTFSPSTQAMLVEVELPRVTNLGQDLVNLHLVIRNETDNQQVLAEQEIQIAPSDLSERGIAARATFPPVALDPDKIYSITAEIPGNGILILHQSTIANENWDEGLPVPFNGNDPFGGLYTGITIENRWYDDENKREMFYEQLAKTDYIILPSQRGIWSVSRLQQTYPMTIEYYRALFDGRLGYELVAEFDSPLKIGPLWISDVGGTVAWNQKPKLPLFNFNFFAAEEAFSVYDHPPVWIFKKTADFDIDQVKQVLGAIDLSKVVIQSPVDARPVPID